MKVLFQPYKHTYNLQLQIILHLTIKNSKKGALLRIRHIGKNKFCDRDSLLGNETRWKVKKIVKRTKNNVPKYLSVFFFHKARRNQKIIKLSTHSTNFDANKKYYDVIRNTKTVTLRVMERTCKIWFVMFALAVRIKRELQTS